MPDSICYIQPMKSTVLIVGGGLAGLSLYAALDKEKYGVTLAERNPRLANLGFGILFLPIGYQALKRLGYADRLIADLGKRYEDFCKHDQHGLLAENMDYRPLARDFGPFAQVGREQLYQLLTSRIPKENIRHAAVASIWQNDGAATATFADGTTQTYDYVIGADGVHSAVRTSLFPEAIAQPSGMAYIWAWVSRDASANLPSQPGSYAADDIGMGLLDIADPTRICVFFWFSDKENLNRKEPETWLPFLREKFAGFTGIVPGILANLPPANQLYMHYDYSLELSAWHQGNVAVLGDAAHAITIFSGLGSSLALEDGLFMGKLLNSLHPLDAFREFERVQRPRTQGIALEKLGNVEENLAIMRAVFSSSPLLAAT